MAMKQAKFSIGQCVYHRLFDYRGVVVDVDPEFQGSADWYDYMARSGPPKNEPWYHVLVHDAETETYVAERNLTEDLSNQPVNHPRLDDFFVGFGQGIYQTGRQIN
jgi:heat shock protein HspQ